jgi:hypothetical protein
MQARAVFDIKEKNTNKSSEPHIQFRFTSADKMGSAFFLIIVLRKNKSKQ